MLLYGGLLAGSLGTGVLLVIAGGLASPIPSHVRLVVFGGVAIAAAILQVVRPRWRFPNIHRQVPEAVFGAGELRSAGRFGFELGLGWRTKLTTLGSQTVALGCVLLGLPWPTVALVGIGFATGRFAHVFARSMSRTGDEWDERLARDAAMLRAASVAGILAFLTVAVGPGGLSV